MHNYSAISFFAALYFSVRERASDVFTYIRRHRRSLADSEAFVRTTLHLTLVSETKETDKRKRSGCGISRADIYSRIRHKPRFYFSFTFFITPYLWYYISGITSSRGKRPGTRIKVSIKSISKQRYTFLPFIASAKGKVSLHDHAEDRKEGAPKIRRVICPPLIPSYPLFLVESVK